MISKEKTEKETIFIIIHRRVTVKSVIWVNFGGCLHYFSCKGDPDFLD